jgi:endonuclease/exonuclease/phosphatase family metal-dependent hydrolase
MFRPPPVRLLLAALALLAAPQPGLAQVKVEPYLFCFWNVENFFDDKVDRRNPPDKEFDDYFAKDKEALAQKLDRLCSVLLEMKGGKGPDILAVAEVESARAAELLMQKLNERLKKPELQYKTVVFKDPGGGRSIATAVITRLKVKGSGQLLGNRQRILKVPLDADGQELVVIASHWTARVSDKDGGGRRRYAEQIARDFAPMYARNPKVDYLVCGDFNDDPTDESVVKALQATGDVKRALEAGKEALLFNPFAEKHKKGEGTHYFGPTGQAHVFDQVCLSPGLLDGEGWSYRNNSAQIIRKFEFRGRPDRFGGPADKRPWRNRGASDHFPVTVELRVSK